MFYIGDFIVKLEEVWVRDSMFILKFIFQDKELVYVFVLFQDMRDVDYFISNCNGKIRIIFGYIGDVFVLCIVFFRDVIE